MKITTFWGTWAPTELEVSTYYIIAILDTWQWCKHWKIHQDLPSHPYHLPHDWSIHHWHTKSLKQLLTNQGKVIRFSKPILILKMISCLKVIFNIFGVWKFNYILDLSKLNTLCTKAPKIAPTENNIHISQKLEIRLVDFYTIKLKPKNPRMKWQLAWNILVWKLFSQTTKEEQLQFNGKSTCETWPKRYINNFCISNLIVG